MTIIISDEIIQASQLTPKEFCQEIALYLFETGHLTVGYASQLADMPTDIFRQLLKQRHIPLYSQDLRKTTLSSRGERPFAPTDGVQLGILRKS